LLEVFGMISTAFSKNDLPLTAKFLDDFRGKIQAHLLTENIRFYIYLEHSLTNDTASSAMVHDFRQEMDEIGKAVLAFLMKYREIATRPDYAIPFSKDLEQIGKVLVDRIRREEDTLYPLYFRVY
jgi:regulator of sigma D